MATNGTIHAILRVVVAIAVASVLANFLAGIWLVALGVTHPPQWLFVWLAATATIGLPGLLGLVVAEHLTRTR